MASSIMRLFQPAPRQTNVLVALACAALGYALYLRFLVIEAPSVEAACAAGLPRAICSLRNLAIELYRHELFGAVALVAASVHLYRPKLVFFTIAAIAAIFGLMLYNSGTSALAVAFLVMGFARPVPLDMSKPARAGRPRTTAPASSKRPR